MYERISSLWQEVTQILEVQTNYPYEASFSCDRDSLSSVGTLELARLVIALTICIAVFI